MRPSTVLPVLTLALLLPAQPVLAGQAVVTPSHAGVVTVPITVTQLAPPACAGMPLTAIVTADSTIDAGTGGNGNGGNGGNGGGPGVTIVRGTNGADLLLGTPGDDLIDGRQGTDCLVAGGGADTLDGGQDADVCVPGTLDDVTNRCETVV